MNFLNDLSPHLRWAPIRQECLYRVTEGVPQASRPTLADLWKRVSSWH